MLVECLTEHEKAHRSIPTAMVITIATENVLFKQPRFEKII